MRNKGKPADAGTVAGVLANAIWNRDESLSIKAFRGWA